MSNQYPYYIQPHPDMSYSERQSILIANKLRYNNALHFNRPSPYNNPDSLNYYGISSYHNNAPSTSPSYWYTATRHITP
jgi:hypothetical protein